MKKKENKKTYDRAITPEQKEEIINRLKVLWLNNPKLRLGQLILNASEADLYYAEDRHLIDILELFYKRLAYINKTRGKID